MHFRPFLGMKAVPILPAYLQEEVIVKKREKKEKKIRRTGKKQGK